MGFEPATSDFVDLSLITYCRPTAALNSNYKFVITFFIMARLIRYYTYNSQHRCVHRVPDATSAAKRRCGEQVTGLTQQLTVVAGRALAAEQAVLEREARAVVAGRGGAGRAGRGGRAAPGAAQLHALVARRAGGAGRAAVARQLARGPGPAAAALAVARLAARAAVGAARAALRRRRGVAARPAPPRLAVTTEAHGLRTRHNSLAIRLSN